MQLGAKKEQLIATSLSLTALERTLPPKIDHWQNKRLSIWMRSRFLGLPRRIPSKHQHRPRQLLQGRATGIAQRIRLVGQPSVVGPTAEGAQTALGNSYARTIAERRRLLGQPSAVGETALGAQTAFRPHRLRPTPQPPQAQLQVQPMQRQLGQLGRLL